MFKSIALISMHGDEANANFGGNWWTKKKKEADIKKERKRNRD